jgi:FAD/FMN-containing dehydrogenase
MTRYGAVWNAARDRHSALIIGCTGTADVIKAVEFARSQGSVLAVRGGGAHSIAGPVASNDQEGE